MKMMIRTLSLIFFVTLNIFCYASINIFANEPEPYINDIPFNTADIAGQIPPAFDFLLEDESYIDDIPFDTYTVVMTSGLLSEVYLTMEEEAYIDDIPFNTSIVIAQSKPEYKNAIAQEFYLDNEEYIDDIPFNTHIVYEALLDISSEDLYVKK